MNSLQLLGIIQRANHLSKDDFLELLKLHEAFPYFQIPKVLLAKYEFEKSTTPGNELLPWAAITSPDRAWLKKMIETHVPFQENRATLEDEAMDQDVNIQKPDEKKSPEGIKNFIDDLEGHLIPEHKKPTSNKDITATLKKLGEELAQSKLKALERLEKGNGGASLENINPVSAEPVSKTKETEPVQPESIPTEKEALAEAETERKPKRRGHKDDLIESIRKKEKKEIHDKKKQEQIDIIKAFSKKEIKLATIKEIEGQQNQEDLSENSTKLNPNLITEAYAGILVKQGKKTKAKEIYKKLMVKFPEKNTYFAKLIEELEKK
ncbi:hypothetical protein [Cecembia sp.]|uniref:hypothetical protein n=1 Tax=Cecembia sp. TaxID=1898110 RepID=UPI0025C5C51B|nr:hypothetical protein [Cecembia sp.]